MFICSKHLYIDEVSVQSLQVDQRTFLIDEEKHSLCSEEQKSLGFTEVKDGQWKTFYKKCG